MSKRHLLLLPAMLLLTAAAFVAGFLRGYTWSIEYTLNGIKHLRRNLECREEGEWVYGPPHPKEGQKIEEDYPDRHAVPFAEVPTWLGNFFPLNRISYDLAEPLHHIRPSTRADEHEG